MKTALFISIAIFILCGKLFAQINESSTCPKVSVLSPPGIVMPQELAIFVGNLDNSAEKLDLQYRWTVSGGKIVEGQGTLVVKALQKQLGEPLTLTLEVIGLPVGCKNTSSETMLINIHRELELLEEFSIASSEIHKTKLNNFAVRLQENLTVQGYIIERFKDRTSSKTIEKKNQRTLDYLQTRRIEKERITFLNAPADKNSTQLILVPAGAILPIL